MVRVLFASYLGAQGVSAAGSQEGLADSRSGLIEMVFKVWDSMDPDCRLVCLKFFLFDVTMQFLHLFS